jgi:hypothetical protein
VFLNMSAHALRVRWRAAPVWFRAVLLGTGFFLVFLVTANFNVDNQVSDVWATALPAWHLAQHGSPYLDGFRDNMWIFASHGHFVSNRFPGAVLAAVPAYWAFGNSAFTILPAAATAAFLTAAALATGYVVLRRYVRERVALSAVAVLALCTATWTVSADALWTHGLGQASLAVALLCLMRGRYLPAGLACGLAVLARPHLALVGAVFAAWLFVKDRKRPQAVLLAAGMLPGIAVLLVYNHALFHTWSISGGYHLNTNDGVNSGPEVFPLNVVGTLISPERGILVLMPFVAFLVPGLRAAWRRTDSAVHAAAVAGATYLGAQLYMNRFSGGDGFFGNRLVLESLILWLPLAAVAYEEWTARLWDRRIVFGALVGYAFVIHGYAALVNWMPHGGQDPWRLYATVAQVGHTSPWVTATWFGVCLVGIGVAMRRSLWRERLRRTGGHRQPIDAIDRAAVEPAA